ncbi:MAG: hypothetical protein GEU88_12940 [Solirubrobacterales bacterium]|nr:hypothetical protein [Solirubrobacterales bacterium]
MEEVAAGVHHWSAIHPSTGGRAHSHLLEDSRTVLDPMVDDDLLAALRARPPERVVLTNRHHWRQADRLVAEFGCPVLCPEPGRHEFAGDDSRRVQPYSYGDRLAPGVLAQEFAAICPDDAALQIAAGDGFLAFADGLVHRDGELGFVSDGLLGDDPERIKRDLVAGLERLVELDFDGLLFAHGAPIAHGGREALREFLTEF